MLDHILIMNTDLRKKAKNDFGKDFLKVAEKCSVW